MKRFGYYVFLIIIFGCSQNTREAGNTPTPILVEINPNPSDFVLGDRNAPVTIIEFSDFQCPSCFQFFQLMNKLKPDYINQGKVKFIFRNYPLPSHKEGESAAIASLCAGKQSKFWEMHAQLFLREGALNKTAYLNMAREIGLDVDAFKQCLDDPSIVNTLRSDKESYSEVGVNGTPTFVINHEMYRGVPPEIEMRKLIERHLKEAAEKI